MSEGDFVTLGYNESLDTLDVIEYLKRSGKVDKICLWGRSMVFFKI